MKSVLPTKRQVIAELEFQLIFTRKHFPYSTKSIRCLELALQVVKEWKQPKGK